MFRLILIAVWCALCSHTWAQDSQRPNVLFIFLDDYGWRDCGYMGSDFYETPNIDALARSGMIFSNAYSAAANCAPARASLLSGQYSPRHEIYNVGTKRRGNPKFGRLKHVPGTDTLKSNLRTWAHQIQQAGYRTATIGKWHLSKDPLPYGFDVNVAGSHSGSPPKGYFPPHPGAPGLDDAAKGEYLTDRLTDEAIDFISANQDSSWLLYLTHFAVHTPLQAPEELIKKYEAKPKGKLHNHAVMGAMIESVDTGIGRIVDALDELGIRENTVILFTSDNGGYGPATSMRPLKGYKGTYYEGGIREPFFVVWPGVVEAQTKCDVPIVNVDVYPTLCEITGAALPKDQPIDGASLVPIFKGEAKDLGERSLFWHFPAYLQSYQRTNEQRDPLFRSRPCSIIRHGKWKLHEYFEDGGLELYDLHADIGEKRNVAAEHPEIAKDLHQRLIHWRESVDAPVPSEPNPRFDAEAEAAAIEQARKKSTKK